MHGVQLPSGRAIGLWMLKWKDAKHFDMIADEWQSRIVVTVCQGAVSSLVGRLNTCMHLHSDTRMLHVSIYAHRVYKYVYKYVRRKLKFRSVLKKCIELPLFQLEL